MTVRRSTAASSNAGMMAIGHDVHVCSHKAARQHQHRCRRESDDTDHARRRRSIEVAGTFDVTSVP